MSNKERSDSPVDVDFSVIRTSIDMGHSMIDQIMNGVHYGSLEIQNYLYEECDFIMECKVCRNLFRSFPNFVAHKRVYCAEKHKDKLERERSAIIQEEEEVVIVQPDSPNEPSTSPPRDGHGSLYQKVIENRYSGKSREYQFYTHVAETMEQKRAGKVTSTVKMTAIPTNPHAMVVSHAEGDQSGAAHNPTETIAQILARPVPQTSSSQSPQLPKSIGDICKRLATQQTCDVPKRAETLLTRKSRKSVPQKSTEDTITFTPKPDILKNKNSTNRSSPVEKRVEKKSPAEKPSEKKSPSEKIAEKKSSSEKIAEKKSPAEKIAEKKSPSEKIAEKKSPVEKIAEKKSLQERPAEKISPVDKPTEKKSILQKTLEKRSVPEKRDEKKIAVEKKPAGDKKSLSEKEKSFTEVNTDLNLYIDTSKIRCKKCSLSFERLSNLKAHLSTTHGIRVGEYACPKCSRYYSCWKNVLRHLRTAHDASKGILRRYRNSVVTGNVPMKFTRVFVETDKTVDTQSELFKALTGTIPSVNSQKDTGRVGDSIKQTQPQSDTTMAQSNQGQKQMEISTDKPKPSQNLQSSKSMDDKNLNEKTNTRSQKKSDIDLITNDISDKPVTRTRKSIVTDAEKVKSDTNLSLKLNRANKESGVSEWMETEPSPDTSGNNKEQETASGKDKNRDKNDAMSSKKYPIRSISSQKVVPMETEQSNSVDKAGDLKKSSGAKVSDGNQKQQIESGPSPHVDKESQSDAKKTEKMPGTADRQSRSVARSMEAIKTTNPRSSSNDSVEKVKKVVDKNRSKSQDSRNTNKSGTTKPPPVVGIEMTTPTKPSVPYSPPNSPTPSTNSNSGDGYSNKFKMSVKEMAELVENACLTKFANDRKKRARKILTDKESKSMGVQISNKLVKPMKRQVPRRLPVKRVYSTRLSADKSVDKLVTRTGRNVSKTLEREMKRLANSAGFVESNIYSSSAPAAAPTKDVDNSVDKQSKDKTTSNTPRNATTKPTYSDTPAPHKDVVKSSQTAIRNSSKDRTESSVQVTAATSVQDKTGDGPESRHSSTERGRTASHERSRTASNDHSRASSNDRSRTSSNDHSRTSSNDRSRMSSNDRGRTASNDRSRMSSNDLNRTSSNERNRTLSNDHIGTSSNERLRASSDDGGRTQASGPMENLSRGRSKPEYSNNALQPVVSIRIEPKTIADRVKAAANAEALDELFKKKTEDALKSVRGDHGQTSAHLPSSSSHDQLETDKRDTSGGGETDEAHIDSHSHRTRLSTGSIYFNSEVLKLSPSKAATMERKQTKPSSDKISRESSLKRKLSLSPKHESSVIGSNSQKFFPLSTGVKRCACGKVFWKLRTYKMHRCPLNNRGKKIVTLSPKKDAEQVNNLPTPNQVKRPRIEKTDNCKSDSPSKLKSDNSKSDSPSKLKSDISKSDLPSKLKSDNSKSDSPSKIKRLQILPMDKTKSDKVSNSPSKPRQSPKKSVDVKGANFCLSDKDRQELAPCTSAVIDSDNESEFSGFSESDIHENQEELCDKLPSDDRDDVDGSFSSGIDGKDSDMDQKTGAVSKEEGLVYKSMGKRRNKSGTVEEIWVEKQSPKSSTDEKIIFKHYVRDPDNPEKIHCWRSHHIDEMINEPEKKCLKCHMEYTSMSNLRRHVIRHLGWKRYQCRTCLSAFYNKADCRIHFSRSHNDNLDKYLFSDCYIDLKQEASHVRNVKRVTTMRSRKEQAKHEKDNSYYKKPKPSLSSSRRISNLSLSAETSVKADLSDGSSGSSRSSKHSEELSRNARVKSDKNSLDSVSGHSRDSSDSERNPQLSKARLNLTKVLNHK